MSQDISISPETQIPDVQSLERRRIQLYMLSLFVDMILVIAGFLFVGAVYLGDFPSQFALDQSLFLLPIYMVLALYNRTYSIKSLSSFMYSCRQVLMALLLSGSLLIFITFYAKATSDLSRVTLTFGIIVSGALVCGWRYLLSFITQRFWGASLVNLLIIEDDGPPISLPGAYRVMANEHRLRADHGDPAALDRFGRFVKNMDRIVISCPVERREHWAFLMRAAGVEGEVVSNSLRGLRPIALRREGDYISLVVSMRPLGLRNRAIKRIMDLVIAGTMLILLSPILLIVAALIKLWDGGPIFFVQQRMGRGNTFFSMVKFRSMKVENSDLKGDRSASKEDDRITGIGKVLRRTSLDEVPQLINVLFGNMSLVGPRPHALGSLAGEKLFWEVDGDYWHRHSLKPGLTGLAQIRGFRGATDIEADLSQRLDSDLEYIANWSPWRDLMIIIKTAGVLIHSRAF